MSRWIFFAILFFTAAFGLADEGLLNKLLAPGPLMSGHKNLEGTDCLKCHEAGKGISTDKCISCHKEIKPFIDAQRGFHGLASKTQNCIQCHADHKGRTHDTTIVDSKNFDHLKLTGYALEGKHAKIKCQECHKEKRTNKSLRPKEIRYLGTKAISCKSCHNKDDVHFFKSEFAKKDCNVCHTNSSWKEGIKFNHDTDTSYKLVEKHTQLKCNNCHLQDKTKKLFRYKWDNLLTNQCLSCHTNFHKNRLSPKNSNGKCATCHNQTKWTIEKFDHKITGYDLKGKHSDAMCIDCHKPHLVRQVGRIKYSQKSLAVKDLNFTGLGQQCLACHDDFHKFDKAPSKKLGDLNQCSRCHDENSWNKTHFFDHDTQTAYPLAGKHVSLKCADCHFPRPAKQNFKGTLEAFPKGTVLSLRAPTYHWNQLSIKTCETCHISPHVGQFSNELQSKKCTTCHTPEDWFTQKSDSGFDHGKTRFALDGAHKVVACNDCHGNAGNRKFKFDSGDHKFCIACHENIHEKKFNEKWNTKNCTQCHSTEKFLPLRAFDHGQTNYQLKGQHEKLKCGDCHQPSEKKYLLKWPNFHTKTHNETVLRGISHFQFPNLNEKSCTQCHEDYHKGQLSQSCHQCHSEKSWKTISFDHNKQGRFPLLFKHASVKCEKCHTPSNEKVKYKSEQRFVVKYKPLSSQCMDCHKDPHKGNFGKTCQECHNEKGWRSTKDFHKYFTLSGVHYALDCSECHMDGRKLAGLSQQCISCHQKDDVHNGSIPACKNCHTQHFWEITSFRHSLTKFPLRGAHRVIECTDCHNNGMYKGLSSNCSTCHLTDFQANPSPHTSGNINCVECHKNTFTFHNAR